MTLYKQIYFIAILSLFFFSTNIQAYFIGDENLFRIHPSFFILLFAFVIKSFFSSNLLLYKHIGFFMFVGGFIIIFGKYITAVGGWTSVANYVFIPSLVCMLYPSNDISFQKKILRFLILMFILNNLLAITEKVLSINVFPPPTNGQGFVAGQAGTIKHISRGMLFRSTAFFGSPLTNALCMTGILVFILMSTLDIKNKLILFVLGYIGILCFNTRTSIMLWPLLLILFLFYYNNNKILSGAKKKTVFLFILLTFFILLISFLLLTTRLGDRLYENELIDNSANVRIAVLEMFLSMNLFDLFFSFGMPYEELKLTMDYNNIYIIENSLVLYIYELGGIGLLIILVGYYAMFKNMMKGIPIFVKIYTLGSFILLGMTNNGLKEVPISIFILCLYVIPMPWQNQQKYSCTNALKKTLNN